VGKGIGQRVCLQLEADLDDIERSNNESAGEKLVPCIEFRANVLPCNQSSCSSSNDHLGLGALKFR
jgi:hypothetical protein